jgi:hypothetical protein
MAGNAYPATATIAGIRPPLDNDKQACCPCITGLCLLQPNLNTQDRALV